MKRHRTDGVSLAFGVLFLGAGGLWLAARVVGLDAAAVGWLVAGGLVLLGVVGLAQIAVSASRRHSAQPQVADPLTTDRLHDPPA